MKFIQNFENLFFFFLIWIQPNQRQGKRDGREKKKERIEEGDENWDTKRKY